MTIKSLIPMGMAAFLLVSAGCDVEEPREGSLPDADTNADAGRAPEYDVDRTQEARTPDVDVDAEGGRLPEYNVDEPDLDFGRKTAETPSFDENSADRNFEDQLDEQEDSE